MPLNNSFRLIHLLSCDSTNRWLSDYVGIKGEKFTVVFSDFQTSGVGQCGNKWESERGKNLLFSVLWYPKNLDVSKQFSILCCIALAICDLLNEYYTTVFNDHCPMTIKWPNDIYFQDRKICGILSECNIVNSRITRCIAGIGINVNQQSFTYESPNAISLYNIIGKETSLNSLLERALFHLSFYIDMLDRGLFDEIHSSYLTHLYGLNRPILWENSSSRFTASIETVTPDGYLVLRHSNNHLVEYAFKEIRFKHIIEYNLS